MSNKMGREKRGPLALELWAKQLIDGYSGVCVRNMTTSWRNGLAFCALIHRFRPDLIDYDKLDPSDIIGNCALAFDTAESKLGIPALLDPEDMANLEVPDRLSVLTYVAQFYSVFKNAEAKSSRVLPRTGVNEEDNLKNLSGDKSKSSSPEKMVGKRKVEVDEDEIMDKVKKSMPRRSIMLSTSNVCSECKNPVFISERILFMKKLFHRTCFRCSHCNSPLNPHVADVSPDGLLFCAETNCHLELLKQFHVSSTNNLEVPEHPRIPESAATGSTDRRNISEVDSSYKENVPLEANHLHDSPHEGVKPIDDVFSGDSHSQGDFRTEPEVEVPLTPKPNRLMDFAGAMLHADQNENDDSEMTENANESTEEMTDTSSQPSVPDIQDSKEIIQNKDSASEDVLVVDAKRTPEAISLRGDSVLTVADQLRVAAATLAERNRNKSDTEPEIIVECDSGEGHSTENLDPGEGHSTKNLDSGECHSMGKLESASDSTISENSLPVSVSQVEIENGDTPVISPEESESALENSTSTVSNPFEEEDAKPSKNEDELKSPQPLPRVGSIRKTPVPSPRVHRKSQQDTPPGSGTPEKLSPTPSPVPKSRVKQPTDSKTNSAEELWKKTNYYPADLNPFESEEDVRTNSSKETKTLKKEPKNPFEDDEDDDTSSPNPQSSNSSTPISKQSLVEINNNKRRSQNAANFQAPPPRPPPPQLSPRKTPIIVKPYNPFEDDEDIGDFEDDKPSGEFSRGTEGSSSISSKTSDLSSISSMPTPVVSRSLNTSDAEGSHGSLKKSRKSRRAPLPPRMTATPPQNNLTTPPPPSSSTSSLSPPSLEGPTDNSSTPVRKKIPASPKLLRGLKNPTHLTQPYRKKRRAPFPKRRVDPLPEESIQVEFADLDVRQKELERQGITLESSIRQLMDEDESQVDGSAHDGPEEDLHNHSEQLDEMIIQLWSIVNEKNDILRRQTELEYLRRGHRLEEMQADLEFKYRNLMDTPPEQREPNHADMEQLLLQQLLKVVDERNEVVEWLDYHRQLDREEDLMVSQSLSQFSNPKGSNEQIPDANPSSVSKTKVKDKSDKKPDNSESKSKSKEEPVVKEKKGKLKLGIFSSKKKKSKAKAEEENKAE